MIPKLPPLADVLNLLPDAVCVVDAQGRFLFVSASFERIFGYTSDEVLGRKTFDLVHPDDRATTMHEAEQVTAGALQRHFRNRYVHKDGHSIDVQWSAHWLPDHGVRIGVAREVSELRRAERELEHRASHDPLTGLPNRHRLQRELQHAIEHAAQTDGGLALLYLDLDGPFQLDASVGIACFPTDGSDPDTLLAHADRAMYAAKRQTSRAGNPALGSTPDGAGPAG